MKTKVKSLEEAVSLIKDDMMIGLGGNVLHRSPMAFVREMARQNIKNLRVVKTAGGHDIDVLSAFGNLKAVDAGFIGYETKYGLAKYYRKAVQDGIVKANEHACYTVISALRASKAGVGFMPVRGLMYGDLIERNDYFKVITDPFTSENITVVKALKPDYSIIHVHEADDQGNAYIEGPLFDDILLSLSSEKVIIVTEKLIPTMRSSQRGKDVKIPGFLVEAVVVAKEGARPGSCHGLYDVDDHALNNFLNDGLDTYLDSYKQKDRLSKGGFSYVF